MPEWRCSSLYQVKKSWQKARAAWIQPKRSGKSGPVLQCAKVAFRIRVVVGNIGTAMRFGDAQVGQQEGHRLGRHRGAAIRVNRQLTRLNVLLAAGGFSGGNSLFNSSCRSTDATALLTPSTW